jgi:hypothetical protein
VRINYPNWDHFACALPVIKKIQNFKHRNIPLNLTCIIKIDCGLVRASIKRFGCWDNALLAAGYDPEQIRVNRRIWTRDSIINHIRHCIDTGLPCTASVPSQFNIGIDGFKFASGVVDFHLPIDAALTGVGVS